MTPNAEMRRALTAKWGLPNAWPVAGDDPLKPWTWRGCQFVDDEDGGRVVACWVPEEAPVTVEEILTDPTASCWLKTAIRSALDRDPVDAGHRRRGLGARARRALPALLGTSRAGGAR